MTTRDGRQPWAEYPDEDLLELIDGVRRDVEGPDGLYVRLPPACDVFVVDPGSHLVVMHRTVIVDMCDALEALLARARGAERSGAAPPGAPVAGVGA